MKNHKLDVEKYAQNGFGDLYYGLISFIGRYASQNFDPFEIDQNGVSKYATSIIEMKKSLKTLLEYLITIDEIFLPSLKRNVKLNTLNTEEQSALEERCKEYILLNLNNVIKYNEENLKGKSR